MSFVDLSIRNSDGIGGKCFISWPTTVWGPAIVMLCIVYPSVCLSVCHT